MISTSHRFALSINPCLDGKSITDPAGNFSRPFIACELSIDELSEEIRLGHAWCCATLRNDYRKSDNFIEAQLIAVDIDANLSIERALELDFVRKYGLFLYTSVSHRIEKDGKPACDRFRLVFALPIPESDPDRYRAAVRAVMVAMGESDPACKDSVRYWAGNRNAETKILPGDFLPADFIDQAIERENADRETFAREAENWTAALDKTAKIELVRSALSVIPPRRPGTGTYDESMSVIAALANTFDPWTAIELAEVWSPSQRFENGENWHVPTKIRSFQRERKLGEKTITLGSLLYIARGYGWEPPAEWRTRQTDDFLQKLWKQWEAFQTITPDETVNQRYLNIPPPKKGEILIVVGPTNTGKTTLLKRWATEDFKDLGIIRLGNRNSLERQFCAESDFYHLRFDDDAEMLLSNPRKRIASCLDSLHLYARSDFEETVIYGDEIDGTIHQALFFMRETDNLARFKQALETCDRAVFMSGTVSDHHVDYLRALCPSKKVRVIQNTYQPERPKVYLLAGSFKEEDPEKINTRDRSPLVDRILSDVDAFFVNSDSKHFLNSLERVLKRDKNTETLLITSDTIVTDKDRVTGFLENPNGYIENFMTTKLGKRLIVLASPTMTSGNDITVKYFRRDFHYYTGQLSAALISQKMIRVRDSDCERYLSIPPFVVSDDSENCGTIDQFNARVNSLVFSEMNSINGEFDRAKAIKLLQAGRNDPHFLEAMILKWIREFERRNYCESVVRLLTKQGYSIEEIIEEKSTGVKERTLRDASEEIKEEISEAICNADDKYIGVDQRLIEPKNEADLRAINKSKIVSVLPEIHLSPAWSPEMVRLITFDDRGLVRALDRRYLLFHPETLDRLTASRYNRHARRVSEGKISTQWKDKHDLAFITALSRLKIPIPVDPDDIACTETMDLSFTDWIEWSIARGCRFEADSPAIVSLVSQCKKKAVRDALGRAPGKDPLKFIGFLVRSLGYDWGDRQIRFGDERIRKYSIDYRCDNELILSEITAAIHRRYRSIDAKCTIQDWDFLTPKVTIDFSSLETTCKHYPVSFLAVTDRPLTTIENEGRSVTDSVLLSDVSIDPVTPGEHWGFSSGNRVTIYSRPGIYTLVRGGSIDGEPVLTVRDEHGRELIEPYWKVTLARAG
jgi:Origin of replication binding protein